MPSPKPTSTATYRDPGIGTCITGEPKHIRAAAAHLRDKGYNVGRNGDTWTIKGPAKPAPTKAKR